MNNGKSSGVSFNMAAPSGGVTAGVPLVASTVVGIPATTTAEGELFALHVEGEFELTAETGVAFAIGDVLYWHVSNANLTKTSSGATKIGVCAAIKASAGTKGRVKLER